MARYKTPAGEQRFVVESEAPIFDARARKVGVNPGVAVQFHDGEYDSYFEKDPARRKIIEDFLGNHHLAKGRVFRIADKPSIIDGKEMDTVAPNEPQKPVVVPGAMSTLPKIPEPDLGPPSDEPTADIGPGPHVGVVVTKPEKKRGRPKGSKNKKMKKAKKVEAAGEKA